MNTNRRDPLRATAAALAISVSSAAFALGSGKDLRVSTWSTDTYLPAQGINVYFPEMHQYPKAPVKVRIFVTGYPVVHTEPTKALILKDVLSEYTIDLRDEQGKPPLDQKSYVEALVTRLSGDGGAPFEAPSYAEALAKLAEKDGATVPVDDLIALPQTPFNTGSSGLNEIEIRVGGLVNAFDADWQLAAMKYLSADDLTTLLAMNWDTLDLRQLPGEDVVIPFAWSTGVVQAMQQSPGSSGEVVHLQPDPDCIVKHAQWSSCFPYLAQQFASSEKLGSWYSGNEIEWKTHGFWGWHSLSPSPHAARIGRLLAGKP